MLRLPAVKRWVFCVGALRVRFGEAGKRCADGQGGILGVMGDRVDLGTDAGDLGYGM